MCPGASDTFAYGIGGGNARGLLAVIPEPATLSLLAIGMLLACRVSILSFTPRTLKRQRISWANRSRRTLRL